MISQRRWRQFAAIIVITSAVMACGCLSIGGRIVNENPETESRLQALETRVTSLEQATGMSNRQ